MSEECVRAEEGARTAKDDPKLMLRGSLSCFLREGVVDVWELEDEDWWESDLSRLEKTAAKRRMTRGSNGISGGHAVEGTADGTGSAG